jgi:hypothetical protein
MDTDKHGLEGMNFRLNQELLTVTAVFTDFAAVREYFKNRLYGQFKAMNWEYREGMFSLDDCFTGSPTPGAAHKHRVLVFSPKPQDFTLFTVNLQDGWNSLAYNLTREKGCSALCLQFSSDDIEYPARAFTWTDKAEDTRHVSVRLEDKWSFFQQGLPLPQEDVTSYSKRLIKSRLTNEQLWNLAKRFGVEIGDATVLTGNGILFWQKEGDRIFH